MNLLFGPLPRKIHENWKPGGNGGNNTAGELPLHIEFNLGLFNTFCTSTLIPLVAEHRRKLLREVLVSGTISDSELN